MLRVSFRKFYPGFNPQSFFVPLIESALDCRVKVVDITSTCDLEIVSVYHQWRSIPGRASAYAMRKLAQGDATGVNESRPSHLARRSIWYTAENIRPPVEEWDATWSYDVDSQTHRNVYFPLWWLLFPQMIPALPVSISPENRIGRELTLEECTTERRVDIAERPRFLCAFVGNPEPTRMRALKALATLGEVDIYGSWNGRTVASKGEVAGKYRFMLCFENDVWPGYVTEKALDAWGCGCIPIWQGLDPDGYLNPSAMLNAVDIRSLDRLLDQVLALDNDRSEMTRMASRPILARRPTLDAVIHSLHLAMDG